MVGMLVIFAAKRWVRAVAAENSRGERREVTAVTSGVEESHWGMTERIMPETLSSSLQQSPQDHGEVGDTMGGANKRSAC